MIRCLCLSRDERPKLFGREPFRFFVELIADGSHQLNRVDVRRVHTPGFHWNVSPSNRMCR